ncbi:hypothetical protein ACFXMT_33770 [Streptomyces mirabilis]
MTEQAEPTGLDLARVALRDGRDPLTLGKAIASTTSWLRLRSNWPTTRRW